MPCIYSVLLFEAVNFFSFGFKLYQCLASSYGLRSLAKSILCLCVALVCLIYAGGMRFTMFLKATLMQIQLLVCAQAL